MNKINIVIFWYMNDWGKYGRTYENIANGMATHHSINKVVCILPPAKTAKGNLAFELIKPKSNLYIITPNPRFLNFTGAFFNLRQRLNSLFSPLASIKLFLRFLGFKKQNTLLWLFPQHPFIDKIINIIPHHFMVTQIVDNVLNKNDIDETTKSIAKKQYDLLPVISDITITSSKLNFDIFKNKTPHCYLVENGIDESFLSTPSPPPRTVSNSRPKLGYLGFISERTNIALLKHLTLARPNYDLIIAGPDEKALLSNSSILDLPNVSHINYIPYSEAPNFIRSLDVCLIPHLHSPFSQSMSPLKLFQYLGSGRPIVSTAVAGTERWSNLIYTTDNFDEFTLKVDEALNEDMDCSVNRIEAVKKETWEYRINCLVNIINDNLN